MWETHSLSFSHIVLHPGSPQPPAKAVNATKDTLPIVPGTAERIELALHSFPASLSAGEGKRRQSNQNGEFDAHHTKELNPLRPLSR